MSKCLKLKKIFKLKLGTKKDALSLLSKTRRCVQREKVQQNWTFKVSGQMKLESLFSYLIIIFLFVTFIKEMRTKKCSKQY